MWTGSALYADAEPGNWMSHGRDYGEQRYSPLKKITDENVDKLGLAQVTSWTSIGAWKPRLSWWTA